MDIVDGDNAAEIAGEQRGLTMTLLADERASERIERVARGQGLPVYSPAYWPARSSRTLSLSSSALNQAAENRVSSSSFGEHIVRHPLCIAWHYNYRLYRDACVDTRELSTLIH